MNSSLILHEADYDCCISLEFLEHVENDVNVVDQIRKGTRCIFSVPNFDSSAHVRYFSSEGEVRQRYGGLLDSCEISFWLLSKAGAGFYLIEGRRNALRPADLGRPQPGMEPTTPST